MLSHFGTMKERERKTLETIKIWQEYLIRYHYISISDGGEG